MKNVYRKKEVNNMVQNAVDEILQKNLYKYISDKIDTSGIYEDENL